MLRDVRGLIEDFIADEKVSELCQNGWDRWEADSEQVVVDLRTQVGGVRKKDRHLDLSTQPPSEIYILCRRRRLELESTRIILFTSGRRSWYDVCIHSAQKIEARSGFARALGRGNQGLTRVL